MQTIDYRRRPKFLFGEIETDADNDKFNIDNNSNIVTLL